jgi:NADPH:quinone reductase-like Zn-dependent oxidoreductase
MTMRAVVAVGYGPQEGLVVADVPGPRQVQVRVRASALNPGELRMLAGGPGEAAALSFPRVVGGDFAGTVTEAGPGVTRFSDADDGYVHGLGASRTVDYRADDIAGQTLRRHPAGVDAVNLALRRRGRHRADHLHQRATR